MSNQRRVMMQCGVVLAVCAIVAYMVAGDGRQGHAGATDERLRAEADAYTASLTQGATTAQVPAYYRGGTTGTPAAATSNGAPAAAANSPGEVYRNNGAPAGGGANNTSPPPTTAQGATPANWQSGSGSTRHMLQSPAASIERAAHDYSLGINHDSRLPRYPAARPGERTPLDLWRYSGRGETSFGNPTLHMPFDKWLALNQQQKPGLMQDVRTYMTARFNFNFQAIPGQTMSGGKPIMSGPIARLPQQAPTWQELSKISPDVMRDRDLFPYKPLAHPLASTAHMVFPDFWVATHPEHERIDVAMDIPDAYLPEFPPPLFLTTHKELGDVTGGREVTLSNYYEIFNGLLTGEQMEGLKELLRPTATTWFNHTDHRVTAEPSAGVACFSCHVNGHTNAAFELAPDSRPNESRLRVDTPTMRGNYNAMQLSSKRSIRSLDHFSEVEEYFDGDPGSLGQPIGLANRQRSLTNRMGDFNAIIDYSPAPKLDALMRLIPELATESELRGEQLFAGKAQCAKCHYGPAFTDDYMHDLRVERYYEGRPEGPIKTFALRGIKDSPPYMHDGRCPTLHDTVEFFNLIFSLQLTDQEKEDLVNYMLCL